MSFVGILNLNVLKKYVDYTFNDFQISINSSKIIKIFLYYIIKYIITYTLRYFKYFGILLYAL